MNPTDLNFPISRSTANAISSKLCGLLRTGLAEAGIPTKNRRYGLIFIESLKWPVAVSVAAYTWEVPVWRITFGAPGRCRCGASHSALLTPTRGPA